MKRLVHPVLGALAFLCPPTLFAQSSFPTVTVSAAPTNEGLVGLPVTFTLSAPARGGERFSFDLVEGSATTADYQPFDNGAIAFQAGETTQTLFLTMVDDRLPEADETFQMVLSNPEGVAFANPVQTLTILNDDGELALPDFFADGMVLQRQKGAKFWGYAKPGVNVSVSFASRIWNTMAGSSGRFEVTLDNLATSAVGRNLVVTAPGATKTIANVVVGEVWLGSGQSNMSHPLMWLPSLENDNEIATANDPLLRVFDTFERARKDPEVFSSGVWRQAVPGSIAEIPAMPYYLAKRLRTELNVPVAVIECGWGGQPIQGFIPEETLLTYPEGVGILNEKYRAYAAWDQALADYAAAYQEWQASPSGPEPEYPAHDPQFEANLGGQLFNGMVAPVIGYGVRGMFWVHGEANTFGFSSNDYREHLVALAADWRARWGEELPFYYMQLPNFVSESRPGWVRVQDEQRRALASIGKSGIAIVNEIGDPDEIHPPNKSQFADRLARWPLANEYGKTIPLKTGPLYQSSQVVGSSVVVTFDYGTGLKTRDGLAPGSFELMEEGGDWIPAQAIISGEKVIVSATGITTPAGVRYAWSPNPVAANLVNAAGLPASVFEDVPAPAVEIFLTASAAAVEEAAGSLPVTFTLSTPAQGGESFRYSLANGSAKAGEDFVAAGNVLVEFAEGATSRTVYLPLIDDNVEEADEAFTLTIANASGLTLRNPTLELTILNDDQPVEIVLTLSARPVNEGEGTLPVTLQLSSPARGGESVFYSLVNGSATAGSDFVARSNEVIVFNEGETNRTIPITLIDDLVEEPNETFSISLSEALGLTLGQTTLGLTINNDDLPLPPADIAMTVVAGPVFESSGSLPVTFQLAAPARGGESFRFSLSAGTANPLEDFAAIPSRVITFQAGETSRTVNLTIIDDAVVEPDETFALNLSAATGLLLPTSPVTLTILNDDIAIPEDIALSVTSEPASEHDGSIAVNFRLAQPARGGERFTYGTASGTALAGSDFVAVTGQSVVFAAGETTRTVTISLVNDAVYEPAETFSLVLGNATGLVLDQSSVTLTILDDDVPDATDIVVNASANPVNEGLVGLAVTFTLSSPARGGESLLFNLDPGTALPAEDYIDWRNGFVAFDAGETIKTIYLTMVDDQVVEPDEIFTMRLSNPRGLILGNDSIGLTIVNDDITVTVTAPPVNEGLIGYPVTFTLSQPAKGYERVLFTLSKGGGDTANPLEDFRPWTNGLVTFPAGQMSRTIVLTMTDDAVREPDETFTLTLHHPEHVIIRQAKTTLTILNDDTVLDNYGAQFGLVASQRSILADDDEDGIELFLEYAFNLNPTVASVTYYVPGTLDENGEPFGLPVLVTGKDGITGGPAIKYVYIRRTDSLPEVEYITEISIDGINFEPREPDAVIPITEFWEQVEVILAGPGIPENKQCFARVRVVAHDEDGDGF